MGKYKIPLLEQCRQPNIAAEAFFHNGGHPDTYASWSNITPELFQAYLDGQESITEKEMLGIYNLLNSLTHVKTSREYLLSDKLAYYDMSRLKHRRKVRQVYLQWQSACVPAISWDELCRYTIVTRAQINSMLREIENAKWNAVMKKTEKRELRKTYKTAV